MKLEDVIKAWRDRADSMPRGGYPEASAANMAQADTLNDCATALEELVLPYYEHKDVK
jgi:hypothetical protein